MQAKLQAEVYDSMSVPFEASVCVQSGSFFTVVNLNWAKQHLHQYTCCPSLSLARLALDNGCICSCRINKYRCKDIVAAHMKKLGTHERCLKVNPSNLRRDCGIVQVTA